MVSWHQELALPHITGYLMFPRENTGRCNFSSGDGEPLSALETKRSVVIRLEGGSQFRLEGGGGGASPGSQCLLGFARDSSHLENQPRGSVENVQCGILLPKPYLEP